MEKLQYHFRCVSGQINICIDLWCYLFALNCCYLGKVLENVYFSLWLHFYVVCVSKIVIKNHLFSYFLYIMYIVHILNFLCICAHLISVSYTFYSSYYFISFSNNAFSRNLITHQRIFYMAHPLPLTYHRF